jgi:AraC-like DNA-binding protein
VFDDEFRTRLPFWLLVGTYLTLNLIGRLAYANDQSLSVVERILFYYTPQLTKLGFALHIMVIAVLGMKTDLIEQRRRLRAPVALLAGLLISISLGSQMMNQGFQFAIPDSVEVVYNFALAYGITLSIFRLGFSIAPNKPVAKIAEKSESVVEGTGLIEQKLTELMNDKKFYLTSGITIGALAEELGEPEYKVRRVINGKLGFRNFNQYINSMRVKDAEIKLQSSDLSVVNIAKELGYVSLSSFNKAFREINQWTPSEFRAKNNNVRRET